MKTTDEDTGLGGCGYEWDHIIPVGENVCRECGAEVFDEDGAE